MNLRRQHFPPNYWLHLHNHTLYPPPTLPPRKRRHPSKLKVDHCLASLSPHLQLFVYRGSIDKRKGEIRSSKFPLTPDQYFVLQDFGVTNKYQFIHLLQRQLELECTFDYKGYIRGIDNIQFRLQKQQPVICGKKPILLLRVRFHQKTPVFKQEPPVFKQESPVFKQEPSVFKQEPAH